MQEVAVTHHKRRANGILQHYVDAGSGAPVVLLHGFPETSYAWRQQIPVLAQHYRVIAPDLRGYGETEKPSTGYDKRTMANDLCALLDSLGIERIALVAMTAVHVLLRALPRIIRSGLNVWSLWTMFQHERFPPR